MALVEERQVASDKEVVNRFRPGVAAPLPKEEIPELLQVGAVGIQGMAGDIALGGEITDELVDFAFHVAAFTYFVHRLVWPGSFRSQFTILRN